MEAEAALDDRVEALHDVRGPACLHYTLHCALCARVNCRLTPAAPAARAQCARYGELAEVSELLTAGVSVDAADADGRTALFFAAANGHAAVVQLLLANGAVRGAAACQQRRAGGALQSAALWR